MYNKDQYATTLRFFVCAANGKQVVYFCSTNKQGLSWDTSVFQLELIIQMLLKMLQVV